MSAADPNGAGVDERWRELSGSLARFFRRRTRNEEDVDDLVQETFLRVQSGLAALRDAERYGAWIHRIARNVWIDSRRRPQAETEVDLDGVPEKEAEPDLGREVAGWLAETIEELDPPHAEVLRRSELEGERLREIAEDLGVSLSAVKSRVQRGREKVRQRLEQCCNFEFDRRGGLVDYRRRGPDCDC